MEPEILADIRIADMPVEQEYPLGYGQLAFHEPVYELYHPYHLHPLA